MKKENDILEKTLDIAESGYDNAYLFLLDAYKKAPENYGPQTLYFLSCLAGGAGMPEKALEWLKYAIMDKGWWYRPEILEDDDLELLENNSEFISLKSISNDRYTAAVAKTKSLFSWKQKCANNLFLAVHGNTQNSEIARRDWLPIIEDDKLWQIETIQSAEPDGYGSYRWSYDMVSYLPVANAIEKLQGEGYQKIVCGGFSSGCDMLLRTITFTSVRCDLLILQSPWLPFLENHAAELVDAIQQKNIALRIACGSEDKDCLPLAKQLYMLMKQEKLDVKFDIQENSRHQFPTESYSLKELLG